MKEINILMPSNHYIFSVDGGASSSLCAAVSLQGDLIEVEKGKPIAAIHSFNRIRKNLLNLIQKTLKKGEIEIRNCKKISIGIAGTPYLIEDNLIESIEQISNDLGYEFSFLINSDVKTTWAGATTLTEGISVYSGTGSHAYGVNKKGESAGVDFMGSLLGDNGSGYDIGVKALRSIAESLDGRGENSLLKEEFLGEFELGGEADFFRKDWRSQSRRRIAKLAKIVDKQAKSNNKAKEILENAGKALANYGKTVVRRLGERSVDHIYYSGGVFKSPFVLNSFIQDIRNEIEIEIDEAILTPVLGTYLLACKDISVPINDNLLGNLDKIKQNLDKI